MQIIWTTKPRAVEPTKTGLFYSAPKKREYHISGKRYEAQKNINKQRDANGLFKSVAPCQDNMDMDGAGQDSIQFYDTLHHPAGNVIELSVAPGNGPKSGLIQPKK